MDHIVVKEDLDRLFSNPMDAENDPEYDHYNEILREARSLAEAIRTSCSASRERSEALLKLEEVVMWSRVALERN